MTAFKLPRAEIAPAMDHASFAALPLPVSWNGVVSAAAAGVSNTEETNQGCIVDVFGVDFFPG